MNSAQEECSVAEADLQGVATKDKRTISQNITETIALSLKTVEQFSGTVCLQMSGKQGPTNFR